MKFKFYSIQSFKLKIRFQITNNEQRNTIDLIGLIEGKTTQREIKYSGTNNAYAWWKAFCCYLAWIEKFSVVFIVHRYVKLRMNESFLHFFCSELGTCKWFCWLTEQTCRSLKKCTINLIFWTFPCSADWLALNNNHRESFREWNKLRLNSESSARNSILLYIVFLVA